MAALDDPLSFNAGLGSFFPCVGLFGRLCPLCLLRGNGCVGRTAAFLVMLLP
jgi:hypothetical protein